MQKACWIWVAFLPFGTTVRAQTVDESWWQVFSSSRYPSALAVDEANDRVYMNGRGHIAQRHKYMALLDPATGALVNALPEADGGVRDVEPDGNGGWFIGGEFEHVNGEPRGHLAHVDANGSLSSWSVDVNDVVSGLALVNDTLYVVGDFDTVDDQVRHKAAAIRASTGALLPWDPNIVGSSCRTVEVTPTSIFFGGFFSQFLGQNQANLVRMARGSGALLPTVHPPGAVRQITVFEGDHIYVAGSFGVLDWRPEGSDWDPPLFSSGGASCVLRVGNTVYVGGAFTSPREAAAAVDAETGELLPWDPGCRNRVNDLKFHNGLLYVAGFFDHVGDHERAGVAAVDPITGQCNAWAPQLMHNVAGLRFGDEALLAFGWFTGRGGIYYNGAASMRISQGIPSGWRASVSSYNGTLEPINEIIAVDNMVVLVGDFDTVQGVPRHNIAVLDGTTGAVLPIVMNTDFEVLDAVNVGHVIYVCGEFETINDQARSGGLAAFDLDSGALLPWAPATEWTQGTGDPWRLDYGNGTIYFGGQFIRVNGITRRRLAAVDAVTGALTPWNPNIESGIIHAIKVAGDRVYVGGEFEEVNGVERRNLVAIHAVTDEILPWAPFEPYPPLDAYAILPYEDRVYLGTDGEGSSGVEGAQTLMKVDTVTGATIPWLETVGWRGLSLVRSSDRIFMAGDMGWNILGSDRQWFAATGAELPTAFAEGPFRTSSLLTVTPSLVTGGQANVSFTGSASVPAQVRVLNTFGQVIAAQSFVRGSTDIDLPADLANGVYTVTLGRHAAKFVLSR